MESKLIKEFISTIDEKQQLDTKDAKFFNNLVELPCGNGNNVIAFVNSNPEILTHKINNNLVFDYFYEKVISDKIHHPTFSNNWQEHLINCILLLDTIDSDIIKQDKKYLLRTQSTHRSLNKIFKTLFLNSFEIGEPEFLVYSIIARGELQKLKLLIESYIVEDYPAVLDVALRYGRYNILYYFVNTTKIDLPIYGKIIDFENYIDNCRYLYYQEHISQHTVLKHNPPIESSKQDYTECLKLLLSNYVHEVDMNTIEMWCDFIRSKVYLWDSINCTEILQLLKKHIVREIPLTHDFREFNSIIFGKEWSDRKCLVEYCLNLENKLHDLQDRYHIVYDRLKHSQSRCDQLSQFIATRNNTHRLRRGTE